MFEYKCKNSCLSFNFLQLFTTFNCNKIFKVKIYYIHNQIIRAAIKLLISINKLTQFIILCWSTMICNKDILIADIFTSTSNTKITSPLHPKNQAVQKLYHPSLRTWICSQMVSGGEFSSTKCLPRVSQMCSTEFKFGKRASQYTRLMNCLLQLLCCFCIAQKAIMLFPLNLRAIRAVFGFLSMLFS